MRYQWSASEFGRGGGQRHAGQYSKERAPGWASSGYYITKKKHLQHKEKVTEEERKSEEGI